MRMKDGSDRSVAENLDQHDRSGGVAPGKRTLTASAASVQRSPTPSEPAPSSVPLRSMGELIPVSSDVPFADSIVSDAPVQRKEVGGAGDARVHALAEHGTSGTANAIPFLDQIQRSFGSHDVSGIKAHNDGAAADAARGMGATAFATGDRVAFAGTPDLHTAAHEAAHVVQQRSGVQLYGGVGQAGDRYEQHADAVAAKVVAGESAVALLDEYAGGTRATQGAVQRFDAGSGGHQGMEREIAGLDPKGGLGQPDNLKDPEPKSGTREHGANAIYSGNFMQDFSQMHAPFVHEMLKNLPKRPADAAKGKRSPAIGDAGSEAITDSIIRALAILDVGPTLADSVVKGNMQAYRPEQHVDQPQGYAANTDSVVHDKGPKGPLRTGKRTVTGGDYASQGKLNLGRSTNVTKNADADRDRDLAGSAAPGRQMENPELFKVSDAGLQNHIYNSVEWCKKHWLQAAKIGPTDEGRFHIGAGLHAIEDYFSHSNFIEVALNSYIDMAAKAPAKQKEGVRKFLKQVKKDEKTPGGVHSQQKLGGKMTHVDTLFDATAPNGKRQAVTTGSVSGIDMKASIGHILLPKAPLLQAAIDESIEKIFGLVVDDPSKVSSWDKLKAISKSDRRMAAVLALGEGCDKAGMTLPTPTGVSLSWQTREIPLPLVDNPTFEHPDGVTLDVEERSVTSAVGGYIEFYRDAKETLETIKRYIGYAKYFGPAGYAAVTAMQALIKQIQEWMTEQIKYVKAKIKQQMMLGMVALIDTISGVDSRDQADRTIGDALADVHEHVDIFEHQTSLEARLLPGGDLAERSKQELEAIVGPVEEAPGGGWRALSPLAPSHSEISKDHAAYEGLNTHGTGHAIRDALDPDHDHGELLHPDQHQVGAKHDHTEGSIFGRLARALATEADRHVLRQVEIVWQDRGTLYGDKGALDTSKMEVGHDAFKKEAAGRAVAEEKRASKTGYRFAQSDAANADQMSKPGVRDLMNLVDLILAHPDDSNWWKTVASTYIDANPDEVARHIRERNATRGNRRRIPK